MLNDSDYKIGICSCCGMSLILRPFLGWFENFPPFNLVHTEENCITHKEAGFNLLLALGRPVGD